MIVPNSLGKLLLFFVLCISCIINMEENGLRLTSLKFSPGGVDFYTKYLLEHRPLIIKDNCQHWPIVKGQWHNLSYINEIFSNEKLPVLTDEGQIEERPFGKIVEFKLRVKTEIPSQSRLLEGVYLPFILQCNGIIKNILSVELRMNDNIELQIKSNNYEALIVPFATAVSVAIFDDNVDVEAVKSLNMKDLEIFRHPIMKKQNYKFVDLEPGDLLYIPAHTWYHIMTHDTIHTVQINFQMFQYTFDTSMAYVEALSKYRAFLQKQPSTINCSNTEITIKEALTIDFSNEEAILHLRIPKRNERPQDVVLASGYTMPVLGLGTALLNESTYNAVKYALSIGYRLFDSAYGYPFSEESIAKAIHDSSVKRDDIFIVTKLHPKFLGYNETLFAIDVSLERLQSEYIDLYLIHSTQCDDFLLTCDEGEPHGTWKQSWRAMEEAKKQGKIRSLGVSNFYGDMIIELLNWSVEPISVIQNWFDPFNQDLETRQLCQKYNIRYMGYSTLGSRWKFMGLNYNPVMESDMITAIAGHYDYVISHVVLRWAIHMNVTVIPRSANENHIGQNLRSLDISLHESDIESLNDLSEWIDEYASIDLDDTKNKDIEDVEESKSKKDASNVVEGSNVGEGKQEL